MARPVPGLVLAFLSFAVTGLAAAPAFEWIDVHVHLAGGGAASTDFRDAARAAVEAMDQARIRTMVVMSPPLVGAVPSAFDHEQFLPALRRYPKRFAFLGGGATLNPMLHAHPTPSTVDDIVRRQFAERARGILADGAIGFGEISAHHLSMLGASQPYASIPADHPLLRLLADIAAEAGVVIDLQLDPVVSETAVPAALRAPSNPAVLKPNVEGFERLLEHNRGARIVWAHAGSDVLGQWTVDLTERLLRSHENLFVSIRPAGGLVANRPLNEVGEVRPEWLTLLRSFPDRFVIGGDQFFGTVGVQADGPRQSKMRPGSPGSGGHSAPSVGTSTLPRRAEKSPGAPTGNAVPPPGGAPDPMAARMSELQRRAATSLLSALPEDLARRIAYENAVRLYRLDP